jgi:hypothetical protein
VRRSPAFLHMKRLDIAALTRASEVPVSDSQDSPRRSNAYGSLDRSRPASSMVGPQGFRHGLRQIGELKTGGMFITFARPRPGDVGSVRHRECSTSAWLINSFSDPAGGIGRHPARLAASAPVYRLCENDGKTAIGG